MIKVKTSYIYSVNTGNVEGGAEAVQPHIDSVARSQCRMTYQLIMRMTLWSGACTFSRQQNSIIS